MDSATGAFRVLGVNHLGLAPKDPVKARAFFTNILQLKQLGDELVREQQVDTWMIAAGKGDTRLEILVPTLAGAGPVGKFLEKKGSGIHHVALSVTGLEALLAHLKKLGVRLIDESPRAGAHHTRIAFVHPEAAGGLLVELVEEST